MPLDALITGRIATLEGESGFGWVEAIGIRDGRIAFAGSEVYLETRADPFTERIRLEPDQVAIPGLTDAHLHLAQAATGIAPCRPRRFAHTRRRSRAPARGARAAAGRRVARGSRLGLRPVGRLADCRRAGSGRAGSEGRHLGTRPSRAVGQPRGGPRGGAARWRPARRRHPAGRRPDARRRAVRGGHPAHHDPCAAAVGRRPRARDHRGRAGPGLARRRRVP